MTAPGKIPSKPSYRRKKGWNLTAKEQAFRLRVAAELKTFCDEPFPNGAEILYYPDGTPTAAFWKQWGCIEPAGVA